MRKFSYANPDPNKRHDQSRHSRQNVLKYEFPGVVLFITHNVGFSNHVKLMLMFYIENNITYLVIARRWPSEYQTLPRFHQKIVCCVICKVRRFPLLQSQDCTPVWWLSLVPQRSSTYFGASDLLSVSIYQAHNIYTMPVWWEPFESPEKNYNTLVPIVFKN